MSREIKFRAWSVPGNRMIDLHSVTPFALDKELKQDGVFVPFSDDFKVMQYTGLKDKNGKEIYEGDIIRVTCKGWVKGSEHEVIYKDAGFSLVHAKRHGDEYGVYTRNFPAAGDEYQIIGNIHQNPELLK